MRVRARTDHEIPDRAPLRLTVGDHVTVGERDTRWPAFVFVRAAGGEGWVPSRYLSADSGEATVCVAYDTAELPLAAGDEVTVVERDEESGWWWCRAGDGSEGWVPIEALDRGVDTAG